MVNLIKIIMGLKGSGKTKQLISLVHKAVAEESGNVVCIEKDPVLRYDIPIQARHVYTSSYGVNNIDFFKGFISGLHANNYDITHIFIDGLYKLIDGGDVKGVDDFLSWLEAFGEKEGVNFTVTISADVSTATERMKKYL